MSLWATQVASPQLRAEADAAGEHGAQARPRAARTSSLLGIGAIIGAGIFVLTGHGRRAVRRARRSCSRSCWPGSAALFAGLCYAEFASMIPIAGSAYTYGYATLGELVAWIIGWDLILEYALRRRRRWRWAGRATSRRS